MPVELSRLITTQEQWEAFSHEQKLRRIREGRISPNLAKKIRKDGNEELVAALDEYEKTIRPATLKSAFEAFKQNISSQSNWPSALERFSSSSFEVPRVRMPVYIPPTREEQHEYESATRFVDRLRARYELWRENLSVEVQPSIYVIFPNGAVMNAIDFEADGHNGIAVTGEMGAAQCVLITPGSIAASFCG